VRFPSDLKSTPARYGAALACVTAVTLFRVALNPLLGARNPFFASIIGVLIAARYWGTGPSILVAVFGGAAIQFLVFGRGQPFPGHWDSSAFIFYSVVAIVAMWLMEMQRRDHQKAEASARLASERLLALQQAISEREKEQAASAKLQAIVESSEDAIISKSLDGIIQSWNKAAERTFGYTREEMLGNTMLALLPPDRISEESDIVERIRKSGKVKHFETVRLRKDGRPAAFSLTISPIHDEFGRVVGLSQIARDITEQKQMEEQLRQTQKLESLGVLAGGLAHDFNNLLTGIVGNASLALEDLGRPEDLQSHLDEIMNSSERAALLVRQMLAYAGKGRYIIEPTDISQQISEIIALIRTSIPRSVEMVLQLDRNGARVDADRSQLQQLIMNLAINAAEAIGERPGTVTITTSQRETDQETQVILTVQDTGCGMSAETKAQMFDPFFTTKFTGRGLGLAAVMGIIRTHRGSISVDSTPGMGTTVTVVLPGSSAAPTASVCDEQVELRGDGLVLVVDDEDVVRNLARFTLEKCGYTTELAANGKEGLVAFTARPREFAAVLLDLTMPIMGGEEMLEHLRKIREDIPVVLSSGYSELEALRRFRSRGLAAFLQKPYTATALARKLKQALRSENVPR
jgi:PAS domain S-box-containing protein